MKITLLGILLFSLAWILGVILTLTNPSTIFGPLMLLSTVAVTFILFTVVAILR